MLPVRWGSPAELTVIMHIADRSTGRQPGAADRAAPMVYPLDKRADVLLMAPRHPVMAPVAAALP